MPNLFSQICKKELRCYFRCIVFFFFVLSVTAILKYGPNHQYSGGCTTWGSRDAGRIRITASLYRSSQAPTGVRAASSWYAPVPGIPPHHDKLKFLPSALAQGSRGWELSFQPTCKWCCHTFMYQTLLVWWPKGRQAGGYHFIREQAPSYSQPAVNRFWKLV